MTWVVSGARARAGRSRKGGSRSTSVRPSHDSSGAAEAAAGRVRLRSRASPRLGLPACCVLRPTEPHGSGPSRSLKAVGADRLERDRKTPLGPEHDPEDQAGAEQGSRQPGDRRRPLRRRSLAEPAELEWTAGTELLPSPATLNKDRPPGELWQAGASASHGGAVDGGLARAKAAAFSDRGCRLGQALRRGRTPECAPTLIHGATTRLAARSGGVPLPFGRPCCSC